MDDVFHKRVALRCLCRGLICVTALFRFCNVASAANRIGITEVIAVTGQASPDANGSFAQFFLPPQLNDATTVVYSATLSGSIRGDADNVGLFRWSATESAAVVREGDQLPDMSGEYKTPANPNLSHNDSVAFFNNALNPPTTGTGLYQFGGGATQLVAAHGQTVPGGNGTFDSLGGMHAFNSAGELAFRSAIRTSPNLPANESGIFLNNQNGLSLLAREGQPIADIPGAAFNEFSDPAINDSGEVAFSASLTGTAGGTADNHAIFEGVPGSLEVVVQKGQSAPNGLGRFTQLSAVSLNESGDVSFYSPLTAGSSVAGIFISEGGSVKTIAADGQLSPDGGGAWSISQFGAPCAMLNNAGQLFFDAFRADGARLFRSDGQQLVTIVHGNEPNPDGDGTIGVLFNQGAFNDAGQVAFGAGINGVADSVDFGLFLYDDAMGLRLVVRTGDLLLGSTITGIGFSDEHSTRDTEQTGLNNFGQVAYRFELADGRKGIGLWSPIPEPSSMALAMASLAFVVGIIPRQSPNVGRMRANNRPIKGDSHQIWLKCVCR